VRVDPVPGGFGLWAEQLIAESTGKQGTGLVPCPGETVPGPDRQAQEVRSGDPYEVGQEFFRWEFATAVAGSILGIDPFDQPDVQAAKDKTKQILASGAEPSVDPIGSVEGCSPVPSRATVAILGFVSPSDENERARRARRSCPRATGCVVTHGFGPRYLHSTGQLHKGGRTPATSCRSSIRPATGSPSRGSRSGSAS
jgi:hypothetical protein